jgi:hypothetical protein
MPVTRFHCLLTDRVADFDASCSAAGFDLAGARRFSALYSGLSRSERRVARALAERLWLPMTFEPMLTGSSLGLDDEPEPEHARLHPLAPRFPAGAAALALVQRHRGAHVALAIRADLVEQIAAELAALLSEQVVVSARSDHAVRMLEIRS